MIFEISPKILSFSLCDMSPFSQKRNPLPVWVFRYFLLSPVTIRQWHEVLTLVDRFLLRSKPRGITRCISYGVVSTLVNKQKEWYHSVDHPVPAIIIWNAILRLSTFAPLFKPIYMPFCQG